MGSATETIPGEGVATIRSTLERIAEGSPRAPAIAAPGLKATTYAELLRQMSETEASLRELGISPADRVALVLPNGPRLASAFISVSACSVCAPLNPAYRADEYAFYLSDVDAKALIVEAGTASDAIEVARARGVMVVELIPAVQGAGSFGLQHDRKKSRETRARNTSGSDPCLILHTSGTTSRPKQVPLTQENLLASAASIRSTLRLTGDDRCLNVMPLFHIHGLIGVTLSTVCSGGELVCAPGPRFPEFFDWLREFSPTWYSAVPTIHQAILASLTGQGQLLQGHRLRFIRSSAAPLPAQVMAELERAFGVPVLQAYGMTEASYQIASNPLPPGPRKPGSVGIAAGPEIAIREGEVVIRGRSVTRGYENDPEANAVTFTEGWFRTGDLGYLDPDGYLFLTGRSKEIINRGGEKISPREVDECLLSHGAVAEAVTFSIPHPTLGEDMGAAVLLKPGNTATEEDLRDFVGARLVDYKVPRRILLVAAIPKGPTGKVQRIGLHEKLRHLLAAPDRAAGLAPELPPEVSIEERILLIWKQVLRIDRIGLNDNFFSLGGDSLQAAMVVRLARQAGIVIKPRAFFKRPTIAHIAKSAKIGVPPGPGNASWLARLFSLFRPG